MTDATDDHQARQQAHAYRELLRACRQLRLATTDTDGDVCARHLAASSALDAVAEDWLPESLVLAIDDLRSSCEAIWRLHGIHKDAPIPTDDQLGDMLARALQQLVGPVTAFEARVLATAVVDPRTGEALRLDEEAEDEQAALEALVGRELLHGATVKAVAKMIRRRFDYARKSADLLVENTGLRMADYFGPEHLDEAAGDVDERDRQLVKWHARCAYRGMRNFHR